MQQNQKNYIEYKIEKIRKEETDLFLIIKLTKDLEITREDRSRILSSIDSIHSCINNIERIINNENIDNKKLSKE